MANICSVGLHLQFKYKKDLKAFRKDFQRKIDLTESRNEGVKIASSKWLFDAYICEAGDKSLDIHGSVRWCLEQESMAEWHKYLKRMKVNAYTLDYEETRCCVYGEYYYDGETLWDSYIPSDHKVWSESNTGENSYFDDMDIALQQDGILEQVA